MLVLKLPILYLIGVVWWAVRAEPPPPEPALLPVADENEPPLSPRRFRPPSRWSAARSLTSSGRCRWGWSRSSSRFWGPPWLRAISVSPPLEWLSLHLGSWAG